MKPINFPGYTQAPNSIVAQYPNPHLPKTEPAYYFLSNDKVDLNKITPIKQKCTVIGIATPDFFHVLSGITAKKISIQRIIALDVNAWQLKHFDYIHKLICNTYSRRDFVEKFFCISISSHADRILSALKVKHPKQIRGGEENTGFAELENQFWSDVRFDSTLFESRYGLRAQKTEKGVFIESKTIGGFDKYYATLITTDTTAYDFHPFSLRYGQGFLENEKTFKQLKSLLINTPCNAFQADAASDLSEILLVYRYHPIILWTSNIFSPYFTDRNQVLRLAAQQINNYGSSIKDLPQMDIEVLHDLRCTSILQAKRRSIFNKIRMTPHYKSFTKVVSELNDGKSLEIVNVPQWIVADGGDSKLPDCDYILLDDFIKTPLTRTYSNIFLHILIGHGANEDEFLHAYQKAIKFANRVLILEHNSNSLDFIFRKPPEAHHLIDKVQPFTKRISIPGVRSCRRNYLYVYDNP